jgi:hypothetical protein
LLSKILKSAEIFFGKMLRAFTLLFLIGSFKY